MVMVNVRVAMAAEFGWLNAEKTQRLAKHFLKLQDARHAQALATANTFVKPVEPSRITNLDPTTPRQAPVAVAVLTPLPTGPEILPLPTPAMSLRLRSDGAGKVPTGHALERLRRRMRAIWRDSKLADEFFSLRDARGCVWT
jgi:hypothetical protein